MRCERCGGYVEWKGPLTALTHTECAKCGGTNCQEVDSPDAEEDDTYHDYLALQTGSY